MIKNFRHVCIVVSNLEKSLKFYRDILGLKVYRILTVKGKYPETLLHKKGIELTYVKLRTPDQPKHSPAVFELHYWHNPRISPQPGYNHVSFTVENLDSEYKRLKKSGVKLLSPPIKAPDGRTKVCFALDADKYLIEFIEELAKDRKDVF
jgi:lactoylglutathione lyase